MTIMNHTKSMMLDTNCNNGKQIELESKRSNKSEEKDEVESFD